VAGVLIADYVFCKRMGIDIAALFARGGRYWYWAGFNWLAIGWTVAGFLVYLVLPTASVKNVSCMVITIVGYAVTARLLTGRVPRLDVADAPVTAQQDLEPVAPGRQPSAH
jgi:cytosine/uracil/thiamine/allantoin permease